MGQINGEIKTDGLTESEVDERTGMMENRRWVMEEEFEEVEETHVMLNHSEIEKV